MQDPRLPPHRRPQLLYQRESSFLAGAFFFAFAGAATDNVAGLLVALPRLLVMMQRNC